MNALNITPQQAEVLVSIFRPIIDEAIRESMNAAKQAQEEELRKSREVIQPMRAGKYSTYPRLRRIYSSYEEIGNVINKTGTAISNRMTGKKAFSDREKEPQVLITESCATPAGE